MIVLKGINLGERQRELNAIVKEAAAKRIDFREIKDQTEKSDVDKLFKIDLASKYLNIEYIIEVLQSGDSLYISRALKCTWMYNDDFEDFINADYLHNNVMPFMSTKMKKKLLTAISMHVRNEDRAAHFYTYCMENRYTSIALKFLNFTSDNFKLELLKDKTKCRHLITGSGGEYLKYFIGLSFTLADAYVDIFYEDNRLQVLRDLSYLYLVSDVKYLDLLEKSIVLSPWNTIHLGLRISRSIMKQHKNRVLKKPSLYIKILSKNAIVRYSTEEDVKVYAVALLPEDVDEFWHQNYCYTYKFILDKITIGKYAFIKQIFTEKYPEQEFETNVKFYEKQYYKFMTAEEKETWALQQLASETEILGIGRDYNWYKFVTFDKAFEEIKKLVLITTDNSRRADMVNLLIECAKTEADVVKLMKHYYERHINEAKYNKENFLDRLLQYFDVYKFHDDFWTEWNRMMHNMEMYSMTNCYNCKGEYKIISLIYYIINEKDVPEVLKQYINSEMYFYSLKLNTDKLPKEQQELVFNYLFENYMDKVKQYEKVPYEDEVRYGLRKYVHFILDLLVQYDRTKEDCPKLLNKFMKLDWEEFKCHRLLHEPAKFELTRVDLLRDLKKDANLVIENLPSVKLNIESCYKYHVSTVLKKLKIYFSYDIAQDFLKFFDDLLTEEQLWHKVAQAAAHGIFILGDEKFKADFMTKYAPKEAKINHAEINEKLLRIQQAICSHACYSRPPVPLKYILLYIKGDYVQYCLPMFQSYLANLPLPLCMEFIEAILNTPVSIQKHGIRLAFECFNVESLNKLVLRVWKKTKNISLRMIIFKAIYYKISEVATSQDMLFDTLKTITATLREDDDENVFSLLVPRKLPRQFIPEYVEVAWRVVSQLPLKPGNLKHMQSIINFMDSNINTIRPDFVRLIVDTFIATEFNPEEGDARKPSPEMISLIESKWNLTAKFLVNVRDKDDLAKKMELIRLILEQCVVPLEAGVRGDKYELRRICFNLISSLEQKSYSQDFHRYENVNTLMQYVLKTLQDNLSIEEIYLQIWNLRLGIIGRKVLADAEIKIEDENSDEREIKDVALNLAKEIGKLIKEFVDNNMYYTSFAKDIYRKISNTIKTVKSIFDSRIDTSDMMVIVCVGLMLIEIPQIYLLVLNIVPSGCSSEYEEDYKSILYRIKNVDNKEIRCNLYNKYINSDFTVKDFMHK